MGALARIRPKASASVAVPHGKWDHRLVMWTWTWLFPGARLCSIYSTLHSETNLKDKLPTPDDSPGSAAVSAAGAAVLEVYPAAEGGVDLELVKALLDVSVIPLMIMPVVDPVVDSVGSPVAYPEPPLPVVLVDVPVPVAASSPWPGVADSPVWECSPSFQASPVGSGYGPIPSPTSPSSQMMDGHGPPPSLTTMDQYLPWMDAQFGGGVVALSTSA